MDFKDYFSAQAKEYSKYRPKYPDDLFSFLSSLLDVHDTAWDCATGNGQAALGLVPYFNKIIATDASKSQIENAEQNPKIEYYIAAAENSGIADNSVDLLTVATAIHWIDTALFYPEAERIVKNNGVIAVWTYSESSVNSRIDDVTRYYGNDLLKDYWPDENKKAWDFENKIQLPFESVKTPEFEINLKWDLNEFLNYLYTWSATQNYIKKTGKNPVDLLYNDFLHSWEDATIKRNMRKKLKLKAGRIRK